MIVRADLEDVAAYVFDRVTRSTWSSKYCAPAVLIERIGVFEVIVNRILRLEGDRVRHRDRVLRNRIALNFCDSETIVITLDPYEEGEDKLSSSSNKGLLSPGSRRRSSMSLISSTSVVPAIEKGAVRIRKLANKEVKVDFASEFQLGISVTRTALKRELASQASAQRAVSTYFLNRLEITELTKKDGISLGEFIHEGGVRLLEQSITSSAALSEMQIRYPWFKIMMSEVLHNQLKPSHPIKANSRRLSDEEAQKIGGYLAISLATNVTPQGGIDE